MTSGFYNHLTLNVEVLFFDGSPYLLDDASPSPYVIGEHIVASSSKLVAIDKILSDILPKGERVLIFSVSHARHSCYARAYSL